MIKGHLKLLVMKILSEGEKSGYSLIKHIGEITGYKNPSAGSIYPLLDSLLESRLVTVKASGRKKLYSLTAEGKKTLDSLLDQKDKIVDKLIEGCSVFESIFDKSDVGMVKDMMSRMKSGEFPLREINPEIIELRLALFKLIKEERLKSKREKIKKILRRAIKDLQNLK